MRLHFLFLFLFLLLPLASSYANLTPIPETPPTLDAQVEEMFPPSEDSQGGAGGGAGGGNVTGSVEDAVNNETIVPDKIQKELEEEEEERQSIFKAREEKKDPNKEGSAAVTLEKKTLEDSKIIPIMAMILIVGILITIVIKGRKRKGNELPKNV